MNDNFEINDWVKITMKNKSVICGQVTALGKKLVDGEEHDFYQVRVLDDRETTVWLPVQQKNFQICLML